MVLAYIGAAAVVGLLIGLVTLSVVWTVRRVGDSIRGRSIMLLNTYDKLLEERSRDLKAMDKELQELKKKRSREEKASGVLSYSTIGYHGGSAAPGTDTVTPALLKVVERAGTTAYRDTGTGSIYRTIQKEFTYRPEEVLKTLPIQRQGRSQGVATKLLETVNFNAVYELSTLSREKQYEVLKETLPEEAQPLLQSFCAAHPRFDCITFYDYLQSQAAMEPGPVYLRMSPEAKTRPLPQEVTVVKDENICEGFQIEADNVLYDYCIRMDEIG